VPSPSDELASLLLFYARDGFSSLRLAADIAAWWDRHGHELPEVALEAYIEEHPRLRRSLQAAIEVLGRVVALPAERLANAEELDRSARRAALLADPFLVNSSSRTNARIMAVDYLLSTGRDKWGFVRRYVAHPLGEVRRTYGLEGRPRAVVAARGAVYGLGAIVKGGPSMTREILVASGFGDRTDRGA
jgi:hypothetical protein